MTFTFWGLYRREDGRYDAMPAVVLYDGMVEFRSSEAGRRSEPPAARRSTQ